VLDSKEKSLAKSSCYVDCTTSDRLKIKKAASKIELASRLAFSIGLRKFAKKLDYLVALANLALV
jgi:hypothetical protein